MLHFQATKKLLNTSRLEGARYISEPAPGQQMHSWYVSLCGSGFPGKFLVLYVHEPSLLTVLVKGKTIASTINAFREHLKDLLLRHHFPKDFTEKELSLAGDYVVGKTSSRSMLGHLNQLIHQITDFRYASYDEIDTREHEDILMDWLYKPQGTGAYRTVMEYWRGKLEFG